MRTIRYIWALLAICASWTALAIPPNPGISYPSSNSTGSYTVSWTTTNNQAVDSPDYTLEEKVGSGAWQYVIDLQHRDGESYSFSDKTTGTYTYRVKACDSTGCSAYTTGAVLTVTNTATTAVLTADNDNLLYGGSTTLHWSSANASNCSLTGTNVNSSGLSGSSPTGALSTTTVYQLTCTGNGSITRQKTITVQPAVSASLSAYPYTIGVNTSSTLSWNSYGATSCKLNGSDVLLNSSQSTGPLATTQTYSLVCSAAGNSVTQTATVTVVPQPVVTVSASPTIVALGGNSNLTWSATDAQFCKLGSEILSSSPKVLNNLYVTATYTVTCTGIGGSSSASTTVNVTPIASITSFTATPNPVASNGSIKLNWASKNATACTLRENNGSDVTAAINGTNISKGPLSATTSYTLICIGDSGKDTSRINVVVGLGWANQGLCNPVTGMQKQICTSGNLCTLNSTRDVPGMCSQSIDCNQ